ncbi:MAG: vitamin transporter [Acidobacteriota bacterium]|jgi:iron complex outermembrane receptor protein|nr:vitamin transporter [Acidobacteriota bacterium]
MTHENNQTGKPVLLTKRAGSLALLILLFSLSISVLAQGGATVKGRVTDERGGAVAGAEVYLRSRAGIRLFGRTNEEGAYAFSGLAPGDYILEVTARGFAVVTSEELRVERGQSAGRDFILSVEAINENVVVVATGTPQRADEVSKAVTLIADRQIEARRELTLAESLRSTPGLRVQQQGSYGALTSLRLRGQRNFDTAILLDGLRVRDAGDINGSALPFLTDLLPADLDRVEILRGSGSSIYGTNAIGGVINLVPKTGAGSPRFEASFEGGSLSLFRERLQGSGGIGRRAGYSFGLTRLDVRRGVDGSDEYGDTAGGARFQFDATPSISISANFYGTLSNARVNNNPFSLPSAFTASEQYPLAREGVNFQPDTNNPDQGRRNLLLVASLRLTERVNELFSYTVAYQHVSTRRRNYNGAAVDPRFASFSPFGDFEFNSTNNGQTDTLDARANFQLGRANLLTAGMEFERESLFQESIPSFSLLNDTTDRQRTFAVFGQDQIFLLDERLQISIGVREQFYRIAAADRPGILSSIEAKSSLTGDGAIAYFIRSTGTKLRAHIGNGFRAPSLFERFGEAVIVNTPQRVGDPTLRAEQSIGIDGGFDQRVARDRVRFGATYFYTRLQRVINFSFNDPLGLRAFGGYFNSPGGISRGVESYLEAAPYRGIDLRVSYTYTNSDRFNPSTGLQKEFVIPKHLFGLTLNQRYRAFLFSFDLNRTGSYIAPIFENDFPFRQANLTFKGYTKADAFLSYERALTEHVVLVLFGGADNIFDRKYFENGFRAPGAVGRGGASFRF